MVGKKKRASLNYIKERVWNKIQGWKEKLLSQDDREVLSKLLVQATPTLVMSYFKFPLPLCKDIECMRHKFWWRQRDNRIKIHWTNWESLCNAKGDGGLGLESWRSLMMQCLPNRFGG